MKPATYKIEYITGQCSANNTLPNHIYLAAGSLNEAQFVADEHLNKKCSGSARTTSISHVCDLEIVAHGVYDEDYKRLRNDIETMKIQLGKQKNTTKN